MLARAAKTCDGDMNAAIVSRVMAGEKYEPNNSGGSAGSNKENRRQTPTPLEEPKVVEEPIKEEKKHREKREHSSDKKEKTEKSDKKDKERSERHKEKDSKKDKEKSDKKEDKEKKDKDKERDKSKSRDKDKDKDEKKHRDKDRDKDKDKEKKHRSSSKDKSTKESKEETGAPSARPGSGRPGSGLSKIPLSVPEGFIPTKIESEPSRENLKNAIMNHHDPDLEGEPLAKTPPIRAASSMGRPVTSMARPGTSMGGARPGTAARRAPPRIKRKELGDIEPPKQIESTSQSENTNIITMDDDGAKKDDENDFLMEETPEYQKLLAPGGMTEDQTNADDLNADEHGVLVRKILETKKELESGLAENDLKYTTVVFDEKEREKNRRDMGKLQEFIQNLTRSMHPLGRVLEFMQEDLDSMVKELDQWRNEYKQNALKLKQSAGRSSADQNVANLKSKLTDMDAQIKQMQDSIAATRSKILTNEINIANQIRGIAR